MPKSTPKSNETIKIVLNTTEYTSDRKVKLYNRKLISKFVIRCYHIKKKMLAHVEGEEFYTLEKLSDSPSVDPETNLIIALLKRDIDSIREENKLLREEMMRMAETNRQMTRVAITISLCLFTLVVSILLKMMDLFFP